MHPPPESPFRTRPQLLAAEDLPPEPRQARSRLKREALLRAGLDLFAECGYEATAVEDVAHRAGVAVGGFYQHFRSKRQLLLVLMDHLVEEISRIDLRLTFPPESEPRAVLEQLVRISLSLDWAHAGVHRAWGEAIMHDPALAELHHCIEDWTATLASSMLNGVTTLPGSRPDLDVKTLAWIITLLFWKLAGRVPPDPEPVVDGLTHLLYHALFRDD